MRVTDKAGITKRYLLTRQEFLLSDGIDNAATTGPQPCAFGPTHFLERSVHKHIQIIHQYWRILVG